MRFIHGNAVLTFTTSAATSIRMTLRLLIAMGFVIGWLGFHAVRQFNVSEGLSVRWTCASGRILALNAENYIGTELSQFILSLQFGSLPTFGDCQSKLLLVLSS
eukprot:scaffold308371_cov19-Prasinocladus_malaysianus.AAC.1